MNTDSKRLFYEIAGLRICVVSDEVLAEERKWLPFRSNTAGQATTAVDYTFRIHRTKCLPSPRELPMHETETVCCYAGGLWLYRMRKTAAFYAAVIARSNEALIIVQKGRSSARQLSREMLEQTLLPWLLLQKDRMVIRGACAEADGIGTMLLVPCEKRERIQTVCDCDEFKAVGTENGRMRSWMLPIGNELQRSTNRTAPLEAIVMLSQEKNREPQPLYGEEAVSELMKSLQISPMDTPEMVAKSGVIQSVSDSGRIWRASALSPETVEAMKINNESK